MSSLQSLACAHVLAQSQNSPRQNFYDEDETEYWVDVRTLGERGHEERNGTSTTHSSGTWHTGDPREGLQALDADDPLPRAARKGIMPAGVKVETGEKAMPSGIGDAFGMRDAWRIFPVLRALGHVVATCKSA